MNPKDIKKPNVSEDLAIDLVLRLYGARITSIVQMGSFDDQNYHIKLSSEHQNPYLSSVATEGYTLKIINTVQSSFPDHFDSMHKAMIHIHNKGVRVPIPIPNTDGNTWKLEKVPLLNEDVQTPEDRCGIHLLTFLPGQDVSSVTTTKNLLYQWGSLLSKFHTAAEDIPSTYLKTKNIFWSLENIPELRTFLEGLDADKVSLVNSILDKYPQEITEVLPNLRKGFIHSDFNGNNILCHIAEKCASIEQEYVVDGVLDFEDMHYGTYAWDVGVMLAYTLQDCKTMDPSEVTGHALAGYLKYRSLSDLELSSLKMCIACRLSQCFVLRAYSHKLDPSNSYLSQLMLSVPWGWDKLKKIWNTETEELLRTWKDIQNQYNNNQ